MNKKDIYVGKHYGYHVTKKKDLSFEMYNEETHDTFIIPSVPHCTWRQAYDLLKEHIKTIGYVRKPFTCEVCGKKMEQPDVEISFKAKIAPNRIRHSFCNECNEKTGFYKGYTFIKSPREKNERPSYIFVNHATGDRIYFETGRLYWTIEHNPYTIIDTVLSLGGHKNEN